jgi:hypothetical protein
LGFADRMPSVWHVEQKQLRAGGTATAVCPLADCKVMLRQLNTVEEGRPPSKPNTASALCIPLVPAAKARFAVPPPAAGTGGGGAASGGAGDALRACMQQKAVMGGCELERLGQNIVTANLWLLQFMQLGIAHPTRSVQNKRLGLKHQGASSGLG